MSLIQVGCALVILVVLINVSEQRTIIKVCKAIPPILQSRRRLTSTEQRRASAVLAALRRTWTAPAKVVRPKFKFVRHVITPRRCLIRLPSKRDAPDAAKAKQTDARVESSRNKRSVCPCRKDYRQLTKKEMKDFHKGLKKLKKSGIYDDMVEYHNDDFAPAAHWGAAFLPWHREYLHQLEQEIRGLNGNFDDITVPFWDSAMDETLPDPRDCVVWTNQFWGPSNGQVKKGKLAKNWKPSPSCNNPFVRSSSGDRSLLLTRQKYSQDLLPSSTFTDLAIFSPLDAYHGFKHVYVGGMLSDLRCAPNDPVFFLLHAMIDCIWEEWSKQPGGSNSYPIPGVHGATLGNMGGEIHLWWKPMEPFPKLNIEGLTGNHYTCCAKRPSLITCTDDDSCGSPQGLLFCHSCQCHCKVKEGGDCTGFIHNACYCKKANKTPRCLEGANNKKKCYCT